MKKVLSLVLVLALVLSLTALVGCAEEEPAAEPAAAAAKAAEPTAAPPVQAAETPAETEPAEKTVRERLDAGEEVLIGLSFQGLSDEFTLIQQQFLDENLKKDGFTPVTAESQSDVALQIQQIENFVTMGAVCIMALPPDAQSVKDVCQKAVKAGVYVVFTGLMTDDAGYDISGGSSVNWKELGTQIGNLGLCWAEKTYPDAANGTVKAALGEFSYFSQAIILMDNLKAALATNPKISVVYKEDNIITLDQGVTAAENALVYDKEIRLFFAFQEAVAVGMNNYIVSQPGIDCARYAVFTQGTAQNLTEIVTMSGNNQSVLRGSIVYGGDENPAASVYRVMKALMFGDQQPPYWEILELKTINTVGFAI